MWQDKTPTMPPVFLLLIWMYYIVPYTYNFVFKCVLILQYDHSVVPRNMLRPRWDQTFYIGWNIVNKVELIYTRNMLKLFIQICNVYKKLSKINKNTAH